MLLWEEHLFSRAPRAYAFPSLHLLVPLYNFVYDKTQISNDTDFKRSSLFFLVLICWNQRIFPLYTEDLMHGSCAYPNAVSYCQLTERELGM